MVALRGFAIGLSIVFGGFLLVLLAELYYKFYRKCRSPFSNMRTITNFPIEFTDRGFNLSRQDGQGGSLQDSRSLREAADSEISATMFPVSSVVTGSNDSVYMQGMRGEPKVLFTIKEESQEDMGCQ